MKRMLIVTMMMVFSAATMVLAHEGHEHGKATKPVTLTGEVVDLNCFMMHPESATGPDHAKCAKSCIGKGLPVGFLADNGTLYSVLGKEHESAGALLAGHVGERSAITGNVFEHHGVKAIEFVSIAAAPASATKGTPKSKATPAMYTCTMDPDVHLSAPGECPKCGMPLVLEKKK
jgi:Heavy metal binding domain